jgi:hypothetical protein
MNDAAYEKGGQGEQKISIAVEQNGSDVNVSFQTAAGDGVGSGKLKGTSVESIDLQSTTPNCPGSFQGSLKFVCKSPRSLSSQAAEPFNAHCGHVTDVTKCSRFAIVMSR